MLATTNRLPEMNRIINLRKDVYKRQDENDLSEFLDKDSTSTVVTPQPDTSKVVLDETNNEDVDKEATVDPEKTASTKTNMGAMATILILALGGVAAYYYFKIYKPKKEEDEDDQPEGLETDGLEEISDEEESEDEDFEEMCIRDRLRGVRPFLSNKYDITKHKRYKELADFNKNNAFDVEKYLTHRLVMSKDTEFEMYEVTVTQEDVSRCV